MRRQKERRSIKSGMPPGALVHIGEKKSARTRIRLFEYGPEQVREQSAERIGDLPSAPAGAEVAWIDITGLHDTGVIETAGERFRIHPLTLEDILNTGQRPKAEEFDDYLYIVFNEAQFDPETGRIDTEQISLVVGERFLLSFQERPGDAFDPVRERIRRGRGRIRSFGCGYLAYALIDAVVDRYFAVLEQVGDRIERLEEALLGNPTREVSTEIHGLKREMMTLRRQILPMRQLVEDLLKSESKLIRGPADIFIADIRDHTLQVIDTLESYRDLLSGLLEVYLSSLSNRMNQVMRVLTVIATIFIPLTFIAGVYGMNFRYMPELEWRWGYAAVWGLMVTVGLVMLAVFKSKKWL